MNALSAMRDVDELAPCCGDVIWASAIASAAENAIPCQANKDQIGRQMMITRTALYVAVVGQSIQLDGGSGSTLSNPLSLAAPLTTAARLHLS